MSLYDIQQQLKAPKNQHNSFGKYYYRSCEDILEAVKPLLQPGETVTLSDEIKEVVGVPFVESTATYSDGTTQVQVKAQAGINTERKGMDIAQSFGSSSSYARKYALNGLFLIDDNKDADATNKHGKDDKKPEAKPLPTKELETGLNACESESDLTDLWNAWGDTITKASNKDAIIKMFTKKKEELKKAA